MACQPIDPYSVTKFAAEQMSRVLCEMYGIDATWARIFNPLGPGQDERHLCGWLGQQVASIAGGHAPAEITVSTEPGTTSPTGSISVKWARDHDTSPSSIRQRLGA